MVAVLLLLLSCCVLTYCKPLAELDAAKICGQTIQVGDGTNGILNLITKLDSNCEILLQSNKGYKLAFAFKTVNVGDCLDSRIEAIAINSDLNKNETIFNSHPHFCGKSFSSDKAIHVNTDQDTDMIMVLVKPSNRSSTLAATFLYSSHKVGGSPVWPDVGPESGNQSITSLVTTASGLNDSSLEYSGVESTTVKSFQTTFEVSSQSNKTAVSTYSRSTTKVPSTVKASLLIQNRTCDCMLRLYIFPERDHRFIPVFDISSKQVTPLVITNSTCRDSSRCHSLCHDYAKENFPDGLNSKRFSQGNETVGDYVCANTVKDEVYVPKYLRLVSYQSGCPQSSATAVKNVEYQLCCKGPKHHFKHVPCSSVLQGGDAFGK